MKARVLIADSDFEMLEIYEDVLPNVGCTVRTAQDGLECWRKVRNFRPDLLIIERELRWGGADEVLALMRKDFFDVPVLLTTDNDRPEEIARQFGSPVVRCLQKPFRFHSLVSAIRSTLDGHDGQRRGTRPSAKTKA